MKRVRAEILSTRTLGAYRSLTLVAPELAERARPGQFVAVAMPPGRDFILRRHLTIHQSSRRGGWAGTLEFVVDPAAGPGTAWLADLRAHESLDVIGPLGKPFAYPKRLTNCLLVGEGRSVAGLYFLAQELIARGKRVDMVIGAADAGIGLQADRGKTPVPAGHRDDRRRHAGGARLDHRRPAGRDRALRSRGRVRGRTAGGAASGGGALSHAEAAGPGRRRGAYGVRVRPVRHLRGAGRAQGWNRLGPRAGVRGRAGVQPRAHLVGSLAEPPPRAPTSRRTGQRCDPTASALLRSIWGAWSSPLRC